MLRLFIALATLLVIPAIGAGVSFAILHDFQEKLKSQHGAEVSLFYIYQFLGSGKAGDDFRNVALLVDGSVITALIGLSVLISFFVTARIARYSRSLFSFAFLGQIWVVLPLLALQVLLQGCVLTGSVYYGEVYFTQRVHYGVIVMLGIGALTGAAFFIGALLKFFERIPMGSAATILSRETSGRLWIIVDDVARKVGAKAPTNIIAGIEPTFYVTSSDIKIPRESKTLTGETLYISLPMLRFMSEGEFKAVIAHELAHFSGEDTIYSRRFAPVFKSFDDTLSNLASTGSSGLAALPAGAVLGFGAEQFHLAVAGISRNREFRADKISADSSSPDMLARSLFKISVLSQYWHQAVKKASNEKLESGYICSNLSAVSTFGIKVFLTKDKYPMLAEAVLDAKLAHPTDTHPSVRERLLALKVNPNDLLNDLFDLPKSPAIAILDDYRTLEKAATLVEHGNQLSLGAKVADNESLDNITNGLYLLLVWIAWGHGEPGGERIPVIESMGKSLHDDFDAFIFRTLCDEPVSDEVAKGLLSAFAVTLDEARRSALRNSLNYILQTGGNSDREAEMADMVAEALGGENS